MKCKDCKPKSYKKHSVSKSGKIAKTMHEFKRGTLHSRSKRGPIVKKRKQAVAIAMSQTRKSRY